MKKLVLAIALLNISLGHAMETASQSDNFLKNHHERFSDLVSFTNNQKYLVDNSYSRNLIAGAAASAAFFCFENLYAPHIKTTSQDTAFLAANTLAAVGLFCGIKKFCFEGKIKETVKKQDSLKNNMTNDKEINVLLEYHQGRSRETLKEFLFNSESQHNFESQNTIRLLLEIVDLQYNYHNVISQSSNLKFSSSANSKGSSILLGAGLLCFGLGSLLDRKVIFDTGYSTNKSLPIIGGLLGLSTWVYGNLFCMPSDDLNKSYRLQRKVDLCHSLNQEVLSKK